MRGYMGAMQPDGGMPELLKRQIDRLETAIDLSTDWLEIQYLMVELDQLKALYEEAESAQRLHKRVLTSASEHNPSSSATRQASLFSVIDPTLPAWEITDVPWHE